MCSASRMRFEFDIQRVGFFTGSPFSSRWPSWHWSITTVSTPVRAITRDMHSSSQEAAWLGCSWRNSLPASCCNLYSLQTNSRCLTAFLLASTYSSGLAAFTMFSRCQGLKSVHIGLPTRRSGFSSSSFRTALFLFSGWSKSQGLPSSSSTVRSSAKPGVMPRWGRSLAALVTLGGL